MSEIQISDVIDKYEDGSDTTQDVDVLVWWRDVGQDRLSRIPVMSRQFLTIPPVIATTERVFSFSGLTGLTLSNLLKSLLDGTLERRSCGPYGGLPVYVRTEFLDSSVNNCQTG
jgi:hypothetical protein